jgi:dTDP-glucose 4,6-dehydratase
MRHVITGGSGFVGARLAATLAARGEQVAIFDMVPPANTSVAFIPGDVRNADNFRNLGLNGDDVVYHLAARQFHGVVPKTDRDAWFDDVNVGGTRNLLAAMARGGARRLVFFSTDMTYGRPAYSPVPTTHPQVPLGPYGRSKLAAEQLIREAMEREGLSASIFRPRLIAGAGRLGIFAKLFGLMRRNLPVPMIGSGTNRYQMIAVEDCVSAALRAVEKGLPPGPFNLGSDAPPTVRMLLGEVIERAGSRSVLLPTPAMAVQRVLTVLDRMGLTLLYPEQFAIANIDYLLDTTQTRQTLGWVPARRDSDIVFDAYWAFRSAARVPTASVAFASAKPAVPGYVTGIPPKEEAEP